MSYFLFKTLLRSRNGYTFTPQNPLMVVSSFLRYFSSSDTDEQSFAVSYLINTCGLSPQSALSASKSFKFKTPEKPDLIISFFKKHGFSSTQISEVIAKCPKVLSCNPQKIIFPKVEFLLSKGASVSDLVRILTYCPKLLSRSLENHWVPSFNFLNELLQSEEKAISAVERFPYILEESAYVSRNVSALRENGVPEENILFLVCRHPQTIILRRYKTENIMGELREMGFNPLRTQFVLAFMVFVKFSKSTRDAKVDAYKRWGWSDKDIFAAFKIYPWLMTISVDKIMAVMDFYVKQLGLHSSVIVRSPFLVSLSLEKRLIPRAAVIRFLSSKGVAKLDSSVLKLFTYTEKSFLEKVVNCHEEAPHLLKLYNEKLDLLKSQGNRQKWKKNM